jgi:hypothetical protein
MKFLIFVNYINTLQIRINMGSVIASPYQTDNIFEELVSILENGNETQDANSLVFFFRRCEVAKSNGIPIPMNDLINYELHNNWLMIPIRHGRFNIPCLFPNTPLNMAIYCNNVEAYDYLNSLLS